MKCQESLQFIKRVLLPRELSTIEEIVFLQTWQGQAYREIAAEQRYEEGYIRDVGANLWQCLSKKLGCKVTKKNLRSVLTSLDNPRDSVFIGLDNTENPVPDHHAPFKEILRSPEFPGAPLPFDSPLYVERLPIEQLAIGEIQQPGSLTRIQAPQDMGKTSLVNYLFATVRQQG